MAPLPVLVGVYYGHLSATSAGLPTGNIFCFKAGLAPSSGTTDLAFAQTIATSLCTNWVSIMAPHTSNTIAGYDSKVYSLGTPLNPAAIGHATGTGALSGDHAPVSAAAVIRHAVMRRGRGSQSHSAISPLMASQITSDGKSLQPGDVTGYTTDWNNFIGAVQADFLAAYSGNSIDYVQLSKKGAGATYLITGSSCESLLGTERSRTPRP